MDKKQIVDAIVEVVENQLRDGAPANMTPEEVEAMITLGRSGLAVTAIKIADRLIADSLLG